MPFTRLKLTTFGQTLETKWRQGKGVHFTRVAFGDGLLGNGSMINRTALVSERHWVKIDAIVAADGATQAEVIATMDNGEFDEGFLYREIALMAIDPDTGQEGTYLYDNAGKECEYLNTRAEGAIIHERVKLMIKSVQGDTITFDASGNPLYATDVDIAELQRQLNEKAGLTFYGPASMMETLPLHGRLLITDPDSVANFVSYQDLIWEAQKAAFSKENDFVGMATLSAVTATNWRRDAAGTQWSEDTLAEFRAKLIAFARAAVEAEYINSSEQCVATWAQAQAWFITGELLGPLDAEGQDYPWRTASATGTMNTLLARVSAIEAMLRESTRKINTLIGGQ